ncbi:MAG: hypothetical protein QW702_02710 [Candidatus Bathyarchaeia archaeon]
MKAKHEGMKDKREGKEKKATTKIKIGIFQGKQAKYNRFLLETLYDEGPLSAWELAKKARENQNLHSLHAIFNKRLRILEKKGYVKRVEGKWLLQFKGMIAVLIIQENPKPFNEIWVQLVENLLGIDEKDLAFLRSRRRIEKYLKFIRAKLEDLKKYENWVLLSDYVKKMMEKGFFNLDVIENEILAMLIIGKILHEQEYAEKDLENLIKELLF